MGRRTVLLIAAIVVAALGAALVWMYADRADERAQADAAPVEVLVATVDIGAGTSGAAISEAASVELRTLPAASVPAGRAERPDARDRPGDARPGVRRAGPAPADLRHPAAGRRRPDPARGHDGRRDLARRPGARRWIRQARLGGRPLHHRRRASVAWPSSRPRSSCPRCWSPPSVRPSWPKPAEGSANTEAIPTAIMTLALTQEEAQKVILATPDDPALHGPAGRQVRGRSGRSPAPPPRTCSTDDKDSHLLMTALLEPDVLARDSIRDAIGDTTDTVGSFDELAVLMRNQPELDTVILGPSVDNELALDFADRLRATNPTMGVILVRRRIDAAILTQAIRAGVREVVTERDLHRAHGGGPAQPQAHVRPAQPGRVDGRGRRRGRRPPADGLLPQGRRRQDHLRRQRGRGAGRQGLQDPAPRPRPRLRRRPDLPGPAPRARLRRGREHGRAPRRRRPQAPGHRARVRPARPGPADRSRASTSA